MFKNILLPLDLTDKHHQAATTAAELARQSGGSVVLVHVVETIPGLPADEEKPFYSRLERSARSHLQKVAAGVQAQGVLCTCEVILGHRAAETVAYAKRIAADLIILTAPPFKPDHPLGGWGSMS